MSQHVQMNLNLKLDEPGRAADTEASAGDIVLYELPGFEAVGLKWEGTFAGAEAGEIRDLQDELKRRIGEIPKLSQPDLLLGLSSHKVREGFLHYAAVEVPEGAAVPGDMVRIEVPALTCAKYEHKKGQSIGLSYSNMYAWIEKQGYKAAGGEFTHIELYPMAQDSHDPNPAFTILIPIS
ncbi:GyrI-like domain-containing protein [Cohnella ginsengisoli]|uniref:GyrI-like domain-containing protein n=1 Tax=Cohnella ginsengisoli TaxID=425004 RepID=A0A9X4KN64_9BACL|nr:effector binding domain-containing protein [Cohnella ginsengisoli]MDG0795203.1 GyrI-like domain-containing protein [Cohnella ginsengisoli]